MNVVINVKNKRFFKYNLPLDADPTVFHEPVVGAAVVDTPIYLVE